MLYGYIRKNEVDIVARFPWDIGIVSFMVFPELMKTSEGASEKIRVLLEDPYFDLLEVTIIDDGEWRKLYELNKAYGKKFALGLQPVILTRGVNPSPVDESERVRNVEILAKEIRVAGERGYKAVGICSGPNVEGPDREKAKNALIKSLIELASEAAKYNMNLYLETFDVVWDRKRLAGALLETVKIVEKAREQAKNIYIMWDLSHAPLLNESPEILKSYPEFIGHIHIGCAKQVGDKLLDTHPGFYRPGALNTEYDVAKLLTVLSDIKYRGAISFEVRPEEGQHPLEVVNSAKSVLLRAFQLYLQSKV
ncbi:TIM barrel protein [Ignisphaera sp. 4213-co]|uniref:TIM barrel protein n=1 Tax=Ignisphaera cupida TaxID=3050454 RepID=A0ABD4Z644_9CREN|nr:TIM barrel protein [Ignisphaera sp. 4213-co]MDK6028640.1 TIM barrel protein [Ignisphaera sp. 4213-co]